MDDEKEESLIDDIVWMMMLPMEKRLKALENLRQEMGEDNPELFESFKKLVMQREMQ